jgi:ribosomal-protein-alanine N-acetyltransferase
VVGAPEEIRTKRLVIRRPTVDDAESIYAYAGDPIATKYMGWPRHRSLDDTATYLAQAAHEWDTEGVGAYLIVDAIEGRVVGGTGIHLLTPYRAVTGYILVRQAWGRGYATEACTEMVALARGLGLARIEADCHVDHRPSARVLEKAGLRHEGVLRSYLLFPNLGLEHPCDVHMYGLALAE